MNFTTIEYYIYFLPIVILSVFFLRKKEHHLFTLLIYSWIFFWFASGWHLILLLISTIVDWNAGKFIFNSSNPVFKKRILWCSLLINLLLLGIFKYLDFFIDTLNLVSLTFGPSLDIKNVNLILPVGISFYTFQTMSYTIDIYQGKNKPFDSFLSFACYAAFFPQLVAGPIVRSDYFRKEIENGIRFRLSNFKIGITLIVYGLFKKIAIADNLSSQVDAIFTSESDLSNFFLVSFGAFLFGIQIYCDFSAYSTIAIGSAKLFDIDLPQNFNHPFFAKSPDEYWKRWHISLSSWLRDYLYNPIAIRSARQKQSMNLILIKSTMITMLLGGLWHGASWNFVLWGFAHGIIIIFHQLFRKVSILQTLKGRNLSIYFFFSWFLTQFCILFSWILFRVQESDMLIRCIKTFFLLDCNFSLSTFYIGLGSGRFFIIILVFFFSIIHYISYRFGGLEKRLMSLNSLYWGSIMGSMLALTILLKPTEPTDFIYFRF